MSDSTTFQIIGTPPDLSENSQIIFEEQIAVSSIIYFDTTDEQTVKIKLVDLENLDKFSDEILYRAGKGAEPGQIVFEQIEIEILKETLAAHKQLDALLNQTFDNLSFFYRDNDLSDDFITKYYRGLIIQERGFTDASYHRGGLAAKHRFLIASSQAKDLSRMPGANPDHGLVVMTNDSFFKILDVAEKIGHKQIALLHIPGELVDYFNSGEELSSVEQQIVDAARADFDEKCLTSPVESLCRKDWLDRIAAPVGLNDEGGYFYTSG